MQAIATMTSAEFEAYSRLPQNADKRLQLIDGDVYMAARPVPNHQRFVIDAAELIESLMPGGEVIADINLHLAEGHDYEPDVIWLAENSRCRETATGFDGPPELVIEVLSKSTAHLDKGPKFDAYERFGVGEYWLADLNQMLVEVYQREGNHFLRLGVFGPQDSFESTMLGRPVPLAAAFRRIQSNP